MSSEFCYATITPFNAGRKRKYFYPEEIALFEQSFKNIDNILHKDAGCSSEMDYVEQTSWILFLKYLDDFEKDKKPRQSLPVNPTKVLLTNNTNGRKRKFAWPVHSRF